MYDLANITDTESTKVPHKMPFNSVRDRPTDRSRMNDISRYRYRAGVMG